MLIPRQSSNHNNMINKVKIGDHLVGDSEPSFIVAEIGINHNGDLNIAKRLIDAAILSGCDAVKFQKRTPELCVPPEQRNVMRETPWGIISYMDYRRKVEFGEREYAEIDAYCREREILWFASPWDVPSVDFLERLNPVCHKVASACITNLELLHRLAETGRPVILSTGMSTMDQIRSAVASLDRERLILMQSTSTYPCKPDELNLRAIETLKAEFGVPVGYSGHEVGLQTTYAAVVLGACLVERHITLDRAMWGSDHAASIEPSGFMRLVRDIRVIEAALGDGKKRVYDSEIPVMKKLRPATACPARA
jgi:N-acetylneuraminate synthase